MQTEETGFTNSIGVHRFRNAPSFTIPAVIEDTREQTPLPFAALDAEDRLPVVRAMLEVGDYSADGLEADIFVERKSLPDLVGAVTHDRDRFIRELDFAAALPFRWRYLLVVGTSNVMSCEKQLEVGDWRSLATPRSIRATLDAFAAKYGLTVWLCDNPLSAAARLCRTIRYCARHLANVRWTQRGFHQREAERREAREARRAAKAGKATAPEAMTAPSAGSAPAESGRAPQNAPGAG